MQASDHGDTWTTTVVSVGALLEESSQYQQAQAHFQQGQYQDCIHDCEQLAVSYPQEVGVYWLWGKAWAALGNGEKAKHCYQQGIKLQPQQAEGYLKMGELYTQEGNWKTAIACYQQVLQKSPELWEVHYKLGDVLWQHGEVEAAVEAYQPAAELSRVS